MTRRHATTTMVLGAFLPLLACHPARQAPGMDVNNLSDDRGARAGRFASPSANAANETDPADNNMTVDSNQ